MFSLIPAIDIIDQQLVRLTKGDYNQVTTYDMLPIEMAFHYQSLGFNYIHVVDLNGAKDGALINLDVIRSIASISGLTVQVGGGIRSKEHIALLLNSGVSFVILGSLLVQDFNLSKDLIHSFPEQVIAGLDIIDGNLATHGWLEQSSVHIEDMVRELDSLPIHSIVSTDISKDGTFEGLNLQLYQQLSTLTKHSIIASGGVSSISDVIQLRDMSIPNVTGCIVGKAIIEEKISAIDVKQFL